MLFIIMKILIFIIIILFFVYLIQKQLYKPIIYNREFKHISALSYVNLTKSEFVPTYELLFEFVNKYQDNKYSNYFHKLLQLNLTRPPVYVIKNYNNKYEYEVYLYRYDPYRNTNPHIKHGKHLGITLDDYSNFITKDQMDKLNIKPYNNKVFKDDEYIIVSYDVNESFFNGSEQVYNYYLEDHNDKLKYRYYILEEDPYGTITRTNKYGLFYWIFKEEKDRKRFLVDKFESDDCIIFYAYKPKTNTHGLYYEKLSFDKFVYFLNYFKFDSDIINYVKNKYNNKYYFCVSYDVDDNGNTIKSSIFSIF